MQCRPLTCVGVSDLFLQNGLTALMYASANGHREIAQLLLEYDVDVNMQDKVRC